MGGDCLLDTNAVIALRADPEAFRGMLDLSLQHAISTVTMGELLAGARKSGRAQENLQWIRSFCSRRLVLPVSAATAERYAELKDGLPRAGRPIPENDCWIAASALEWGLPLVTRDARFEAVKGLSLVRW